MVLGEIANYLKTLSIFAFAAFVSCAPLKIFEDNDGSHEKRPPASDFDYPSFSLKDRVINKTRYDIQIFPAETFLGFNQEKAICSGEATFLLHYPESRLEITDNDFKLSCMGMLELKPSQLQPSIPQPIDGKGPGEGRLSSAIKSNGCLVLNGCSNEEDAKKNLMTLSFHPPVPYYLPSIVQDPEELLKIGNNGELEQKHRVTIQDGNSEIFGTSRVKIFSVNETMQSLGSSYPFKVVHWERELNGFEDYPQSMGGILPMIGYHHMEWWSSTRPIAIVKIRIKTILKTVLGQNYINSLTGTMRDLILALKDKEVILQLHMINFAEQ